MKPSVWTAVLSVCCAVLVTVAVAAENVYPDPSFEKTGTPGVARTGERAGYLQVGAKQHWVALGGAVTVEPFAKYRASAYVKVKAGEGSVLGVYCYEWNCYEWAFATNVPLKSTDEWQRVEATFISPHDRMFVHPLAFLDAANCEAWVDDVVVERIAEPAAAMAEMMAVANPSQDQIEIIARYLISRGDLAGAKALIAKGNPLTQADIACLLAQKTKDPAERRALVLEMVQSGGLTYNDGPKRFSEMTAGMTDAERLAVCAAAVQADVRSVSAARGYRIAAEGLLGQAGGTCVEREKQLAALAQSVQSILPAVPADAPARTEVAAVSESLQQAQKDLDQRRASLGHCVVKIGGKAVKPETHAIVLPQAPTASERYAASDLQRHLELVTGQVIPVVPEQELGRRTPLAVGKCALLQKLGVKVDPETLGLEGIYVGTVGPALVLVGNQRGVVYACNTFLEDSVGCRWFTPDCSTWPKEGTINVPRLDRTYVPPLEYRAGDYPVARPGDFAAHCRMNGSNHQLGEEQGGRVGVHSLAHTFAGLVPPERYYKDHPEYFSFSDGKRQSGYAQLCLTNPDVLRIVTEGVRRWIKENPSCTVFSVSQNDTGYYCECPRCKAVAEEEGSQSGPIIRFVNAVADNIKDEYPNIAIETLAYQYTRKPPKLVRPRPNVIVCLCSIECCFIHPLGTDVFNESFVDDIKGWSRICKRLWIWDYIINYAHSIMPFPNLFVLKPNTNFFLQNGVTGIYEESCYYTKGSEMQELRNYIIGKTLWDPSYDTDKAINEFVAAYYGPAGPQVRAYIDLIQQSAQSTPGLHVQIYSPPSAGYLTPEVLAKADALFDQAEAAVKDDALRLHRVQVARLPILYSEIALAQSPFYEEQNGELVSRKTSDVSRAAATFEQIAKAEGVTMIREGGPDAGLDEWLAHVPKTQSGLRIERLKSAFLDVSVLPQLGGRIWRARLQPSGADLLKVYGQEGAWNPTRGGLEEYSQSEYRSPGWDETYQVVAKTDRSITLEVSLPSGLKLTRVIEVEADKPVLRVTSTLTNTANAKRTVCLRIHPEFQVGSTQQAEARLLRANGEWNTVDLADAKDPQAEHQVWYTEDRPAGKWAVVDRAANRALVATSGAGEVGKCLLNWSGKDARVNLELYSPETELAEGGSVTIHQAYEVMPPAAIGAR